jgi:hypothetical protein
MPISNENRDNFTLAPGQLGLARSVVLWLLFFSFSLALGYPTLNRYDPRQLGRDQTAYYSMTAGQTVVNGIPFCYRLLVPAVAKPFYWLARGKVGTWDPVWFGMLISNSLFCATFSFLMLLMGYRILRDLPLALLGCTFVLLNYAVPDLWLSGYVDASEACLLMAIALLLYSDKWWPLPLVGLIGGLAKQSFLPFATIFAIVWWLAVPRSRRTYRQLLWIAALAGAAFASIVLAYWLVEGRLMMPWSMASQWWAYGDFFGNLLESVSDHRFLYPFVWLLPLGVWRLNRFPRPWVMATVVTGLFAFGITGYANLGGTVNRPIFNVIALLFGLSTACLIATGNWKRNLPGNESGPAVL